MPSSLPPSPLQPAPTACKICNGPVTPFYSTDFTDGGPPEYKATIQPCGMAVHYVRCGECGFIFTDFFDQWTNSLFAEHVYNNDYILIDPAYAAERPQACATLLDQLFPERPASMLDYGSGSGALQKFLTARGWQSVASYDPFSQPDAIAQKAKLITAFEVVEHDSSPQYLFQKIIEHLEENGVIFFSTTIFSPYHYWYMAPRAGHCSIHSQGSLLYLAKMLNFNIATDHGDIHIMWQGDNTLDHLPGLNSYFLPSFLPEASSAFSQAYYCLSGNRHSTGPFPNKINRIKDKVPKTLHALFDFSWRIFTACLAPLYQLTSTPQWEVVRRHSLRSFYWAGPENSIIFYMAPKQPSAALHSWECTIALRLIHHCKQLCDVQIWVGNALQSSTQIHSNRESSIRFTVEDALLHRQNVTAIRVMFYHAGTQRALLCPPSHDDLYYFAAVFGLSAILVPTSPQASPEESE
jgi:hypothetical protein